jgi:hypothetical protein
MWTTMKLQASKEPGYSVIKLMGHKLVISLPRVNILRLRMLEALPSCPLYAIMVWCFDTENLKEKS